MLLSYFVCFVGMTGMNAMECERLPDGIIVFKGENTSIIEGEWTLLLTIHEDGVAHRLATHTELVRRAKGLWDHVIGIQELSVFFTEQRKALMKAKIGMVIGADHELKYDVETPRKRRGVLDFVGTGLNWAFGTATESQVQQLQSAVDKARTSQRAIVHNVQELITVVNQTQMEGRDTGIKLAALSEAYDHFIRHEGPRWRSYGHSSKLLMMEEYIDSLLWLDTSVWRQITLVQNLHRSLRAGRLTEGLCPLSLLREICQLAA